MGTSMGHQGFCHCVGQKDKIAVAVGNSTVNTRQIQTRVNRYSHDLLTHRGIF